MGTALLIWFAATSWSGQAFGVWKLNRVTVRIYPHTHGEVFTWDTVDADGRASTSSTILYLDGKAREFQDSFCSGTQSSRRVDSRTVEILRECGSGGQIRLIWRTVQRDVLILDITEQHSGGRRSERRLVMEKQ